MFIATISKMYYKCLLFVLVSSFFMTYQNVEGVKFTMCELVDALKKQNFPELQMRTWVCIVENESGRETTKKTPMPDGTFRWGLFQLANPTWCTPNNPGGRCGIKCEDMLTNDITKAAACATTAYKEVGFRNWPSYTSKCQSNLPDLTPCKSASNLFKRWVKMMKESKNE